MTGWEPRGPARFYNQSPETREARRRASTANTVSRSTPVHGTGELPDDLISLHHMGVGLPHLHSAWQQAKATGVPALEILFRQKVISREVWLQTHLLSRPREPDQDPALRQMLLRQAITKLYTELPHYSAFATFTGPQVLLTATLVTLIIAAFTMDAALAGFAMFVVLTGVYLLGIGFRLWLLAAFHPEQAIARLPTVRADDETLPIYSVLVALYRESGQIAQLVANLDRLDWPVDKRDIKLICEADDQETIAAIASHGLPDGFELVRVPPAAPRTKPKALNYALPLCRGEYLALYDAEDLPSPGQLREAEARFRRGPSNLACLQAPLAIHNWKQNWLTAMFDIEYAILFRGVLPVLARFHLPLPLGGTSNHFRLQVLKEVGGWDPYNVTEDADLGIRLFREGYRAGTITAPTYEEAPPGIRPWLHQRTRWLKGWMQTILVHNRNPLHLMQGLGFRNFCAFHAMLTIVVLSALIHPLFLVASIVHLAGLTQGSLDLVGAILTGSSVFNLAGGYSSYMLFALAVLVATGKRDRFRSIVFLPAYWLLISVAGWRAVLHLIVKPHYWEKTPHGLANRQFGLSYSMRGRHIDIGDRH